MSGIPGTAFLTSGFFLPQRTQSLTQRAAEQGLCKSKVEVGISEKFQLRNIKSNSLI